MDFINKDNYNQFEIVMQNHFSYDLKHNVGIYRKISNYSYRQ